MGLLVDSFVRRILRWWCNRWWSKRIINRLDPDDLKNLKVFLFYNPSMKNRFNRILAIPISILFLIGVYYTPPVHDRLAWRLGRVRTQIKYLINPPEEAVFQPTQQAMIESIVNATMTAMQVQPPLRWLRLLSHVLQPYRRLPLRLYLPPLC